MKCLHESAISLYDGRRQRVGAGCGECGALWWEDPKPTPPRHAYVPRMEQTVCGIRTTSAAFRGLRFVVLGTQAECEACRGSIRRLEAS